MTVVDKWTGARALALCDALRMSHESFAHKLGRSPSTVANWRRDPDVTVSKAIAGALDFMLEQAPSLAQELFWQKCGQRPSSDALTIVGPSSATTGAVNLGGTRSTEDDGRGIAATASSSLTFAAWADDDRVSPLVLEHLTTELRRIAVDYVHAPMLPLFGDLVGLRDSVFGLLQQRPHPRQARDLFRLAGTTCILLAHASQNLGDSMAAMAQARAAWACADQADHDDLRAWTRGTQALIAEWSRNPAEAVDLARAGQAYAHNADTQVRLAAIEARTLARLGDDAGAIGALERARHARDLGAVRQIDDLGEFGGVLTFPVAKQEYYAGSTYGLIGQFKEAEQAATAAIDKYISGSPQERSYGDEALAHVDIAIARIDHGDLDGAQTALSAVLGLPEPQRIQQVHMGLARITNALAVPRYGNVRAALDIRQQIESFTRSDGAGRRVLSRS